MSVRVHSALLLSLLTIGFSLESRSAQWKRTCAKRIQTRKKIKNGVKDVCRYIAEMNKNVFSYDTMKVVTGMVPFYIGARALDPIIHECSYCRDGHKNINQVPNLFYHWTNEGLMGCMALTLGTSLWFRDDHAVLVGQVLCGGILSVWVAKNVIKRIELDANLRPWNEHFSSECRAYGGFPSGHASVTSFMATLYGLQYGPKMAFPLGIYAAASFIIGANTNRHYVSQLVAGVALGVSYAIAANKVVDKEAEKKSPLSFGISTDAKGRIMFGGAYEF